MSRKPARPTSTPAHPAQAARATPAGAAADSCQLAIKAIPGAPRNEVCGMLGEAVKVKVHAPPVEGKANEALVGFLAEALGLPRRAVTLLRGDTSRHKTVRIEGMSKEEALRRLLGGEA